MLDASFALYINELSKAHARGDATEHTHRPALKKLIETIDPKITATNEPARIKCGAPDFLITRKAGAHLQTIGYLEAKDIGTDLAQEAKKEQVKDRYLPSLENFILTDYINFRWYVNAELRITASIATEKPDGTFKPDENGIASVKDLLQSFLTQQPQPLTSSKELASRLAHMARLLRDLIDNTFDKEKKIGPLHSQFQAFQKVLLHDLKEEQFADMYAQTICYGLFAARCHIEDTNLLGNDAHAVFHGQDNNGCDFTREHAATLLPKTNPFLQKTFYHIAGPDLPSEISWLVDDVVALLRDCRMDKILTGFAKETARKDPVIHFYETFLAAYDPKLRESRGVYYTPEPVVSYIVRSVDIILKEKFGLKTGLADKSKVKLPVKVVKGNRTVEEMREFHKCLILDPAAGTGTFLYEVIDQIHKNFAKNKGAWSSYVKEHLLPRIYGFELMMAPYTIAHMKLGLQLADKGYDFTADERLRIFLTNTLEEANEMSDQLPFAQWLAEEARQANEAKRDLPIMVVLGNPPYSGHSANASEITQFIEPRKTYSIMKDGEYIQKTAGKDGATIKTKTFIGQLVQDYYKVDGQPLGEKNPKWLQDDYVKFIRFSQWRIQQTGAGVLAFITNHGYLDNPTFRGMRQSLMQTFDEIYILDLHGNAKKKETAPDGSEDKNVFDIQQGVSIGIFIKTLNHSGPAVVHHSELFGQRIKKYDALESNDISTTNWSTLVPDSPFYLFAPQNVKLRSQYDAYFKITDIMPVNVLGFQTHRDDFAIDIDKNNLRLRLKELRDATISDHDFILKYNLQVSQAWSLTKARNALKSLENWDKLLIECSYRPFDKRHCYYSEFIIDRPRRELIDHVAGKANICLGLGRQGMAVNDSEWALVSISKQPIDANIFRRGGINVFPLYLYSKPTNAKKNQMELSFATSSPNNLQPNVTDLFIDKLSAILEISYIPANKGDLKKTFGPEDVLAYMYAVLHSPAYRKRYAEFLKIDFPRIPLPADKEMFKQFAAAGSELISLHLLEADVLEDDKLKPSFPVEGANEVAPGFPDYISPADNAKNSKVFINPTQYFHPVPPETWNFHVGGYQPAEKWLKDRRSRTLTYDDINHYQKMIAALTRTIEIMNQPFLNAPWL